MLKRKINLQLPVIQRFFLPSLEELVQLVLDQQRASKNAHDFEDWPFQLEVVFNDCDEAVSDDCDVDLYAHRIFRLSPELFDTEMLFDPFEEEFHLPAVLVEFRHLQRREMKGIRQKREFPALFGIPETYKP